MCNFSELHSTKEKNKICTIHISVQGTLLWNSLPTELKIQTELNFKEIYKKWFKQKQVCEH